MAIHQIVLGLARGSRQRRDQAAPRLTPFAPVRSTPVKALRNGRDAPRDSAASVPRASAVHLAPAMTVQEAFAAIALNCSAHVMAAARFTGQTDDPEGIHELRVAIRRMRAALSIFQHAASAGRRFRINGELRALQRKLAAAREWDVLVDETIACLPKRLRKAREVRAVLKIAQAKRLAAHRTTHAALRDPHCKDLLRRLHAWIDSQFIYGPARLRSQRWAPEVLSQPVSGMAADVIGSYHRKARKLAQHIGRLDVKELHRLRIRIKKLRYAIEFFASLWPGRALRRYLAALRGLQQSLGAWHDTVVASDLFARLAPAERAEFATTPTGRWLAGRERAQREEIAVLCGRLAKRKRFWETR